MANTFHEIGLNIVDDEVGLANLHGKSFFFFSISYEKGDQDICCKALFKMSFPEA